MDIPLLIIQISTFAMIGLAVFMAWKLFRG